MQFHLRRGILVAALGLAALTACSLQTVADVPTSTPFVVTATPEPTDAQAATNTPQPSNTPQPQPTATGCTPRTDWPSFYTVASGDTLAGIARRTNSTVNALAQGNCLTNPNNIVVGQVLRVPQAVLPPTLTPTATATTGGNPVQMGGLTLSSYISADAGNFMLLRGDTITVRWDGAPASAVRFRFELVPVGDGNSTTLIGEDMNAADGVSVTWTVPAGVSNGLVAYAYRADNTMQAFSAPTYVFSAPPTGQGCEIAPADAEGETAYTQPDASSTVFGTIAQGQYVEILGRSLNGWYGYDAGVGGTGTARLRWLPVDGNYTEKGTC